MKKKKQSANPGIIIFFSAVIIVSIVLMVKNGDTESLETINSVKDDLRVSTELTDPEPTYQRDIDYQPEAEIITSETENTVLPEGITAMSDETDETEAISDETQETSTVTSRTIITSRQRKEYDSNAVYLDMENILQNPELPVGCEITALTILLRHYGFDAEKTDLAKNYLPKSWGNPQTIDGKLYKDSFFDYFIGDPFSKGYGCFSPAIEKAANAYISDHGGGYTVKNISGCHPDTLYEYLIDGIPVLCWATDGMIEPEYYETWYDHATGEQLEWYLNEHCFVLAGFNISSSVVTLNDPMKGIIDYNIDKFEVRFKQMHSQAIVIIPDSITPKETESETTSVPDTETETEATAVCEEIQETFADTESTETDPFYEDYYEPTEYTY